MNTRNLIEDFILFRYAGRQTDANEIRAAIYTRYEFVPNIVTISEVLFTLEAAGKIEFRNMLNGFSQYLIPK